ncbi:uncharacterized protein LOC125502048 [Athalia rosae]|uniref:uncharacterized protein LOC125502048 n=1 Tax=Athalia rosae TaxID=37344 RepID=UPI002033703C|nr:uncharacterized protein LOC125502048 [Athalia rosae]
MVVDDLKIFSSTQIMNKKEKKKYKSKSKPSGFGTPRKRRRRGKTRRLTRRRQRSARVAIKAHQFPVTGNQEYHFPGELESSVSLDSISSVVYLGTFRKVPQLIVLEDNDNREQKKEDEDTPEES